jgi:hypothetical protein
VKIKIQIDLEYSIAKHASEREREKWAGQIFENCKPEFDRYWQEYCEHLKKHGWVEVVEKKDLRRQCKWFLRYAVEGKTLGAIEIEEKRKVKKSNISQHRIKEIRGWLDMDSLTRGGRNRLRFTWAR